MKRDKQKEREINKDRERDKRREDDEIKNRNSPSRSCDSTFSQQRFLPVFQILLQPLDANLSDVILLALCFTLPLPPEFGDDSLWFWSDERLCLQIQSDEVFSIKSILIITADVVALIVIFTARQPLVNVGT